MNNIILFFIQLNVETIWIFCVNIFKFVMSYIHYISSTSNIVYLVIYRGYLKYWPYFKVKGIAKEFIIEEEKSLKGGCTRFEVKQISCN